MSERLHLNPEQQAAYNELASFFGRAEESWPVATTKLVNIVGGLVGEKPNTQKQLADDMKNIDVGLALIGDWLGDMGLAKFDVNLGFGGGAKKAIGRARISFPAFSDLTRVKGKDNQDLEAQTINLLTSFSRRVEDGLKKGLSSKEIIGGLVKESIGSGLSIGGSLPLRLVLEKPVNGHFEWLRDALGVPDVATQAGFTPKLQLLNSFELKPLAVTKKIEPKVVATPEERKEIILTKEEEAFIKLLEVLENYEQGNRRLGEDTPFVVLNRLGKAFDDLEPDSPIRKEVMTTVVKQLGEDGDKLMQRKEDEKNIFSMWGWRMNVLFEKQQKPHK